MRKLPEITENHWEIARKLVGGCCVCAANEK